MVSIAHTYKSTNYYHNVLQINKNTTQSTINTNTHIYTHTYIHTYTHTYIHTHTILSSPPNANLFWLFHAAHTIRLECTPITAAFLCNSLSYINKLPFSVPIASWWWYFRMYVSAWVCVFCCCLFCYCYYCCCCCLYCYFIDVVLCVYCVYFCVYIVSINCCRYYYYYWYLWLLLFYLLLAWLTWLFAYRINCDRSILLYY